jgi:hypothetical protein
MNRGGSEECCASTEGERRHGSGKRDVVNTYVAPAEWVMEREREGDGIQLL